MDWIFLRLFEDVDLEWVLLTRLKKQTRFKASVQPVSIEIKSNKTSRTFQKDSFKKTTMKMPCSKCHLKKHGDSQGNLDESFSLFHQKKGNAFAPIISSTKKKQLFQKNGPNMVHKPTNSPTTETSMMPLANRNLSWLGG